MRPVERVAALVAADLDPDFLLSRLDRLPERIVDDAQFRHRYDFPFIDRVWPGDALAGPRILDVAAAVPLKRPSVERVVEEAAVPRSTWPLIVVSSQGRPPGSPKDRACTSASAQMNRICSARSVSLPMRGRRVTMSPASIARRQPAPGPT